MPELAVIMETTKPLRVSVVIPVYANAGSLARLCARIAATMRDHRLDHEIIFVDDASPDDSWTRIEALAQSRPGVRGLRHGGNRGQHRAALAGLGDADGDICVVMDADLQDPPEAIPALLRALRTRDSDVVFAGRVGDYQAWHRMLTSRLYRRLVLAPMTGLPGDAGMFFAIRRDALDRLLAMTTPGTPMLIGMIAAAKLRCLSVPVMRESRPHGSSAYSGWRRLRAAMRMVRSAWFARPSEEAPLRSQQLAAIVARSGEAGRRE